MSFDTECAKYYASGNAAVGTQTARDVDAAFRQQTLRLPIDGQRPEAEELKKSAITKSPEAEAEKSFEMLNRLAKGLTADNEKPKVPSKGEPLEKSGKSISNPARRPGGPLIKGVKIRSLDEALAEKRNLSKSAAQTPKPKTSKTPAKVKPPVPEAALMKALDQIESKMAEMSS